MPATSTAAAVAKIILFDATVITDVESFITTAGLMVDAIIGDRINSTQQEVVCRYLSAHLIAITDNSNRIQSEQVKSLQNSYTSRLSDGLGITHWGTMAMQLDPSGKLANWNKAVVSGRAGAFDLFHAGTNADTSPEVY